MRINTCFRIGRLEIYIGRMPHWPSIWSYEQTGHCYQLWAGRWEFIADWLPSKRQRERARIEWLAKVHAKVDAIELAEARTSWPAREAP